MKSVADPLRAEQREEFEKLSIPERVAHVFELGELGIAAYCAAHNVDRAEAIRRFRLQKQVGRRYSRCMIESLE